MNHVSETFKQAVALHRAGKALDAERLYQQVVRLDPAHADALHLLGVAALQSQRHAEAADLIRRAISLNGRQAAYHSNLGTACRALGRTDEAVQSLRTATQLAPQQAEFHFNLANVYRQRGELDEATNAYETALTLNSNYADAHNNLANLLKARGEPVRAAEHYSRVIEIDPRHAEAHLNLGLIRLSQRQWSEAEELCRRSVELRPDLAEGHNGLGMLYLRQGQLADAVTCYEQALRLRPDFCEARNNLGTALLEQGETAAATSLFESMAVADPSSCEARINLANAWKSAGELQKAIACLEQLLQNRPDVALAHNNLGNCWKESGEIEKAIAAYSRAVELNPDFAEAHANLAQTLQNDGEAARALTHYNRAIALDPSPKLRIQAASLLPPIYDSKEDLLNWRERLTQQVTALNAEGIAVDPSTVPCATTFYLPYQGFNDRALQVQIGQLHRTPESSWEGVIRPANRLRAGKIRIGFISRYLHNHTIGRLMRGCITLLSRDEFEVTLISVDPKDDDISRLIRSSADRCLDVSERIPVAIREIRELELDILLFTDIGMDPVTYSLAHCRLAGIQCATWGHPITSGLSTIDYFLSSGLFETDDADEHYSESLVRLDSPGVHYYRPDRLDYQARRSEFDLPGDKHLYGCLQSLFKLHPEFDPLLGEILRQDPLGELVLLSGARPNWNRLLHDRFRRSIPDVVHRIRFVPRQSYERFLRLNTAFDVLLDPLHYSGGNTSYEALAYGIPIVTLPSRYLRGRITYGLYRQMNVMDCVAGSPEEYVQKAVTIGQNEHYRRDIHERILDASPRLYEDRAAILELERFFQTIVRET